MFDVENVWVLQDLVLYNSVFVIFLKMITTIHMCIC